MKTVGAFEAKTHLAALLARVASGESFVISRHGKPVAKLVPIEQHDPERIRAAIDRIKEISAGQTLDGDWREFRDAGRKWQQPSSWTHRSPQHGASPMKRRPGATHCGRA